MTKWSKLKRVLGWAVALATATALGVMAYRWSGLILALLHDEAAFRGWMTSLGVWAPIASIAINAAQVIIAPLPGQVISVANGYLFGFWSGVLVNLIGAMIGTTLILVLVRRWGRPLVARLVRDHDQIARLDRLVARRGRLFFFLVFLLPFMPKDLACYAVGLAELPIGQMIVLIAVGRLPGLVVASWVGANAVEFSTVQWAAMILGAAGIGAAYLRWSQVVEATLISWVERAAGRPSQERR